MPDKSLSKDKGMGAGGDRDQQHSNIQNHSTLKGEERWRGQRTWNSSEGFLRP
jgi:hypothetical protein